MSDGCDGCGPWVTTFENGLYMVFCRKCGRRYGH